MNRALKINKTAKTNSWK